MYYAYIYYDSARDNEPIYVGKGNGNRAWKHLKRKDMHPFTQRLAYMRNNGIVPVIGLYSGLDEELAYLIEEELIAKIGRKDLGKGPLLNLTDGGDGAYGTTHRIGKEHRLKINASLKGLPKSEIHRKRIGAAGRGRIPHNKGKTGIQVAWNKGLEMVPQSDATRQKKREANLGVTHAKIACKVCGKLVGIRSVNRYHNENCKLLPI